MKYIFNMIDNTIELNNKNVINFDCIYFQDDDGYMCWIDIIIVLHNNYPPTIKYDYNLKNIDIIYDDNTIRTLDNLDMIKLNYDLNHKPIKLIENSYIGSLINENEIKLINNQIRKSSKKLKLYYCDIYYNLSDKLI